MKYACEVVIERPLAEVIKGFDSTENLYKWQPTLKSATHLSGEPGRPGAKMKLTYGSRNRDMVMIETILANDLPKKFDAVYSAPGVENPCHNTFTDLGDGTTSWVMQTEFKFSGMMSVASFFMRRAFPRETQASMQKFKTWIESN